MQRPQGISAHADDAPVEPDVGLRLSAALKRLAALRATIHSDWSDGPASLPEVANTELPAGDALCWTADAAPYALAPDLPFAPVAEAAVVTSIVPEDPMPLRGRFSECDANPIDASWLDLVDESAQPLAPPAPDTDMILDEIIVALAFADDSEAPAARPAIQEVTAPPRAEAPAPIDADIVEIDLIEPAFAIGAAPGLFALAQGAVADIPPALPAPVAVAASDATDIDLPCAPFGLHALLALAGPVAIEVVLAPAPAVVEDDGEPQLAVGAFALWFDPAPEAPPVEAVVPAVADEETDIEIGMSFGAAPMLAALLDLAPEQDTTPAVIRLFDPMSLIDDALADAFDALLRAPEPIDPFDAAWTPDAFTADTDYAAHLAACETQFWALPRHVPCAETFLLTPNHEIAVRITRALRVRANALEARAFAETAAFGFLRSDADAQAFWFLADALHDAASLSAGDADVDASFADWRMNDDGLLVVTAPDNAHPRRPPPLISEAELDALFAHVDDAQSRVVLDDLGEDLTWNDTFWRDVDSYLEHVSETMDPAVIDHPDMHADSFEIHDIEVRTAPVPMPVTTFFWLPGDDFDLAIEGDGGDLFIVGANETPAVILIEDGSSHAMRTGQTARMDEVVVSLSFDAWRYIDGMHWRRVATLSGIAQVRVEQNAALTRQAVIAGAFFATTLEDDGVRLVRSGDDGDVDYPVIRVGGSFLDGDDWPSSAAREAEAVFV